MVRVNNKKKNNKKKSPSDFANNVLNNGKIDTDIEDRYDFLDEDPIIPDQKFAVLSFYSPKYDLLEKREVSYFYEFIRECLRVDPDLGKKRVNFAKISEEKLLQMYTEFRFDNYDELHERLKEKHKEDVFDRALKVRGCYKTINKAKKRVQELKNGDNVHNMFVAEVGKWLPFAPDPSVCDDYETSNKQLNKMLYQQRVNANETRQFYQKEREQRLSEAVKINEERKKRLKEKDPEYRAVQESEMDLLGLTAKSEDVRPVKTKKLFTPSKAKTVEKVDPTEYGFGDSVDTKGYKGISMKITDFEHKDFNDYQGNKETFDTYNTDNVDINRAKKDKVTVRPEEFEDEEFDEEYADELLRQLKRK